MRDAILKGANRIVDTAKAFVPVSPGGGDLRDSIKAYPGGAPTGTGFLLSKSRTARDGGRTDPELTVDVAAGGHTPFYARWVEFGTRYAAPHPYFYPAYRLHKRSVKSAISRATKKAIKSVASR